MERELSFDKTRWLVGIDVHHKRRTKKTKRTLVVCVYFLTLLLTLTWVKVDQPSLPLEFPNE